MFRNLLGIFNRAGLVGIQSEEDSTCREEVSVDLQDGIRIRKQRLVNYHTHA